MDEKNFKLTKDANKICGFLIFIPNEAGPSSVAPKTQWPGEQSSSLFSRNEEKRCLRGEVPTLPPHTKGSRISFKYQITMFP